MVLSFLCSQLNSDMEISRFLLKAAVRVADCRGPFGTNTTIKNNTLRNIISFQQDPRQKLEWTRERANSNDSAFSLTSEVLQNFLLPPHEKFSKSKLVLYQNEIESNTFDYREKIHDQCFLLTLKERRIIYYTALFVLEQTVGGLSSAKMLCTIFYTVLMTSQLSADHDLSDMIGLIQFTFEESERLFELIMGVSSTSTTMASVVNYISNSPHENTMVAEFAASEPEGAADLPVGVDERTIVSGDETNPNLEENFLNETDQSCQGDAAVVGEVISEDKGETKQSAEGKLALPKTNVTMVNNTTKTKGNLGKVGLSEISVHEDIATYEEKGKGNTSQVISVSEIPVREDIDANEDGAEDNTNQGICDPSMITVRLEKDNSKTPVISSSTSIDQIVTIETNLQEVACNAERLKIFAVALLFNVIRDVHIFQK